VCEDHEWYQYHKLNTYEPHWYDFKTELLDHFNLNLIILWMTLKKVHQSDKVDEFIQQYERIKARVAANHYTYEQYYLLGFLSGLKDEISDVVILYEPKTLKQAYKLVRQVEHSIESHNHMLKPPIKSSYN
jgi:Ty3 transposon capsid-like protein